LLAGLLLPLLPFVVVTPGSHAILVTGIF